MEKNCQKDTSHGTEPEVEVDSVAWGDIEALKTKINEAFFISADQPMRVSGGQKFFSSNSQFSIDFWDFFEKYFKAKAKQTARQKQSQLGTVQNDISKEASMQSRLEYARQASIHGLPDNYDPMFKVNVIFAPCDESKRRIRQLSKPVVRVVKDALQYFIDFRNKQSLQKIMSLRKLQSSLPIAEYRSDILQAVRDHQVILVAGDTGCGKSTQVPQYLLQAGYSRIVCTQPRRISAISLARRVQYETLQEYGSGVAHQIRFDTNRTDKSRIIFATEGLLLRQLQNDPSLSEYSCILLDEIHERHVGMDLLLAIVRALVRVRRDIRIILMSATANLQLFAQYFGAHVVKVPGRTFPVEIQYIPPPKSSNQDDEPGMNTKGTQSRATGRKKKQIDVAPYLRLLSRIEQQFDKSERGDLLVFLPGINEITRVADAMREYCQQSKRWIVLLLHSSLGNEEQDKVFDIAPDGVRKVILSTNIAETSVTIDGIRFVADSGKAKELVYDERSRSHNLKEAWICRASANQRKGRAGRTGPGVCFRLYSEEAFNKMAEFSIPEIHKSPLESLCLQIKSLQLGDPRIFPFIDPPEQRRLESAMQTLLGIGCLTSIGDSEDQKNVNGGGQLTPLGTVLSQLPVDVNIGKILTMGCLFNLVDEVVTLAAALSIQSPILRVDEGSSSVQLRRELVSDDGDCFTVMNIFDEWIKIKSGRTESSKRWCSRLGFEEQRLYEMTKLKRQFSELLQDAGLIDRDSMPRPRFTAREKEQRRVVRSLMKDRERRKRRRVLNTEGISAAASMDDNDNDGASASVGEVDLQSLDFALSNDLMAMSKKSRRDLSRVDLDTLKLIIASGFYPNVAIPDEGNDRRNAQEAVFHSQAVRCFQPHASSVFSSAAIMGGEVAVFSTLLDTDAPYFTNAIRMPLLPCSLLCGRRIDIDQECRFALVDGWLKIEFLGDLEARSSLLYIAVELRCLLNTSLQHRLSASGGSNACTSNSNLLHANEQQCKLKLPPMLLKAREYHMSSNSTQAQSVEELNAAQGQLAVRLAAFLETHSHGCNATAIKASDALWSLTHPALALSTGKCVSADQCTKAMHNTAKLVQQITEGKLHFPDALKSASSSIGFSGLSVTPYITFGSLLSTIPSAASFSTHMQKPHTCNMCGHRSLMDLNELIQHEAQCLSRS